MKTSSMTPSEPTENEEGDDQGGGGGEEAEGF